VLTLAWVGFHEAQSGLVRFALGQNGLTFS
jgi:hypothetical protein